jgi:GNAT superfamily N-acetyltransferase
MVARLATRQDLDPLQVLMESAISELQRPFLEAAQIASSRLLMGLDSQLIQDGTYFVIEMDGVIAGCGGWSRRATLYGGDQTPGRDGAFLDPSVDSAKVRAMYTSPRFARRGIGRRVLALCEGAARDAGFRTTELMATMAGVPLYLACGYLPVAHIEDARGGVPVPLTRMRKTLR